MVRNNFFSNLRDKTKIFHYFCSVYNICCWIKQFWIIFLIQITKFWQFCCKFFRKSDNLWKFHQNGTFSKEAIKLKVMAGMFCNFFYKIWTECSYEKCPRTWFLLKKWSNYSYVKHAKIKKTPCMYIALVVMVKIKPLFWLQLCLNWTDLFPMWPIKICKLLTNILTKNSCEKVKLI